MEQSGDPQQGDSEPGDTDPGATDTGTGAPAPDEAEPDEPTSIVPPPDESDESTVVGAPLSTSEADASPTPDPGATSPTAATVPPPPPPPAPTVATAAEVPVLDAQNILWYFGALSATVAAVIVVSRVHEGARGFWILLVSLAFMAVYAAASGVLLRLGRRVPGGIVAATAVSFVPLVTIAFEQLIGVGSHGLGGIPSNLINEEGNSGSSVYGLDPGSSQGGGFGGHQFAVAIATVVAGLLVYAFVRYAFVFAWVAIATLIAAELFLPAIASHPTSRDRVDVLLVTGFVFLAIGLYADLVDARRIAFWWYLVGLDAVTSGFAYDIEQHRSPGWLFALAAGAVALVIAIGLHRATWGFFGLLGLWAPVAHYAWHWFGTLGTAFGLFVVGFVLIGIGVMIQQAGEAWTGALARRARHL